MFNADKISIILKNTNTLKPAVERHNRSKWTNNDHASTEFP